MNTKVKIEIKNRWSGTVIFSYEKEGNTLKDTVEEYIRQAAEKDIRANLTDADLTGANLTRANLTRADLTDANLTRADLTDADLTRANLTRADLTDANLTRADLTRADLTRANLTAIKNDFFAVLLIAIPEISNLRKAIIDGKIDGSTYSGECACLAGTLMKCKIPSIAARVDHLKDSSRPIERFFMGISPGHTPENDTKSKIVLEWLDEFEGYLQPVTA